MAYIPPGSFCELCLMADPEICADCEFGEEEEEEEFEQEEEEEPE